MSIIINNFEIINNGTELSIDVETNEGFEISSILLWKMDDFKDYSKAINISDQLEQINNREVLIIPASTVVGVESFKDIIFMEVESTYENEEGECSTCQDPALGITFNLAPYYQCLLKYILEGDILHCNSCPTSADTDMVVTINLLIDMVEKGLEVGYYLQAVEMVNKLKKLCAIKKCNNCEPIECSSCSGFIQS